MHIDISHASDVIKEGFRWLVGELSRPSITLKPKLIKDGNQWCCLYGDNIIDGVAGFGDTPNDAMKDFDDQMNKQ